MGTISRLLLYGRVPPQIIEDYRIRSSQVKSRTSSLQGNQEQVPFPLVKFVAQLNSLRSSGLAIQVEEGYALAAELPTDDAQHLCKLREQEQSSARTAAFLNNL
ncbi:hypothetical protein D3C73_785210 [compost metagenome]